MNLIKLPADLLANAPGSAIDRVEMGGIFEEFRGHLLHRQNMVNHTRRNRAAKDGVVLGGFERLGHGHTPVLLDGLQAACPVCARA